MLYGYHTHIWLVYIIHPIGDFWLVCKTKNLGTKCLQRQKVPWHRMYNSTITLYDIVSGTIGKSVKDYPCLMLLRLWNHTKCGYEKKQIYMVSHVVAPKIVLNQPIRISNRLIWYDILKSSFICTDWYMNELTLI